MRKQIVLLSVWSFLCVMPVLLITGPNIVTKTFQDGAHKFWMGQDPYSAPSLGADVFHYSSFFAMTYGLLCSLPPKIHSLAWCFLNSLVFWMGISAWFQFSRKTSPWLWGALALCAMELDISLRYQQSNSLVIGLVLLGVASFQKLRWVWAGFFLALATNIKIIPGAIAGLLLFPPQRRYWASFLFFSVLFALLPSLVIGWEGNFLMHLNQVTAIQSDMPQRHLLDLKSTLERWHFPVAGLSLKWAVLIATAALFLFSRFVLEGKKFPWALWLTVGIGGFLLLVPRVESPTFVFIAPCYLLLMHALPSKARPFLFTAMFLITFVYTSAWPKMFKTPLQEFWTSKCLGVFVLWCLASAELLKQLCKHTRDQKKAGGLLVPRWS